MKLSIVLLFLSVDFPYSYSVDRDTVKKFVNNLGAAFKPEFHAELIFKFMQEQINETIKMKDELFNETIKMKDELFNETIKMKDELFNETIKMKDELFNETIKKTIKMKDEQFNKTIKMKDEQFNKTIKMKDEQFNKTIKMKDEQFNKTIKMKNDEIEFHLFISTSCWIRETFNRMYKNSVNNFAPNNAKMVIPPFEVNGQPYNTSDEAWLCKSYRKWIVFLNSYKNYNPLAKCLTESLVDKKYASSQMAWSGPKIWKFYNRYSHPDDSPAVVGFKQYMAIRKLAISGKMPIQKTPVINTGKKFEIYNMIRYEHKTFLDVLEARNTWYITKEDCDMINIVLVCINEPELECRPFKNSPKLVVPFTFSSNRPTPEEECYPYLE